MAGYANGTLASLTSLIAQYHHHDEAILAQKLFAAYDVDKLLQTARDGDSDARKAALFALTVIGDTACASELIPFLQTADAVLRRVVEQALWQIWFKSGIEEVDRLMQEGAALIRAQHWIPALQAFNQAISVAPWFPEAYNQRAIVFYVTGQWERSLEECLHVVVLNPTHFGALAGLGHCYLQRNQPVDALDAYERALAINPGLDEIRQSIDRIKTFMRGGTTP